MSTTARTLLAAVLFSALAGGARAQTPARAAPVVVASKPFGESYLLCEMFAQLLEAHGIAVTGARAWAQRKSRLARSVGCNRRLSGVHRYGPAYRFCMIRWRIRSRGSRVRFTNMCARRSMARYGIRWLPPLGFQNTYAIAIRRETSAAI